MKICIGERGGWNNVTFSRTTPQRLQDKHSPEDTIVFFNGDMDFWRSDKVYIKFTLGDVSSILRAALEAEAVPALHPALTQRLAQAITAQQPQEEQTMTPDIQAHIKGLEAEAAQLRAAAGQAAAKIGRLEERLRALKGMVEAATQMEHYQALAEEKRSRAVNGLDTPEA